MRLRLALLLLPVALIGAACGSSSSSTSSTSTRGVVTIPGPPEARTESMSRPTPAEVRQSCPQGAAQMGCAQQAIPQQRRGPSFALPSGPLFPDVSEFQGAVNWGAVKSWQRSHGWPAIAIFKMGEYRLDHQAVRNASQTRSLGFWRAGYIFTRNLGCATEASHAISWARQLGVKVVVEDNEVPEARGYAACVTPKLKAAGLTVVEYTSPGSNPDGGNPGVSNLWVAAYGPSHPPCVFTCSVGQLGRQTIVAWQFTDGQFGSTVSIPGIGRDDVSVSYGIQRLGSSTSATATTAFARTFNRCFQRGYTVHWDRLHHRRVPSTSVLFNRPGCQSGYNAGYRRVKR